MQLGEPGDQRMPHMEGSPGEAGASSAPLGSAPNGGHNGRRVPAALSTGTEDVLQLGAPGSEVTTMLLRRDRIEAVEGEVGVEDRRLLAQAAARAARLAHFTPHVVHAVSIGLDPGTLVRTRVLRQADRRGPPDDLDLHLGRFAGDVGLEPDMRPRRTVEVLGHVQDEVEGPVARDHVVDQ